MILSKRYPLLQIIVQMSEVALEPGKAKELSPRIKVQKWVSGAQQCVKDAAVYILRLPPPFSGVSSPSIPTTFLAELHAHLNVLRANRTSVMLILAPCLLPEPGTVDPDIEATARLRDLSRLQLANEYEMEMGELVELVSSVNDGVGGLLVINKCRSRNTATVALSIKYQGYGDRHHRAGPKFYD